MKLIAKGRVIMMCNFVDFFVLIIKLLHFVKDFISRNNTFSENATDYYKNLFQYEKVCCNLNRWLLI